MEILITFLVAASVCGMAAFLICRSVINSQKRRYEHLLADKDIAQQQALEGKEMAFQQALESKEQVYKQALEAKDLLQAQALEAKEQAMQAKQASYEEALRLKDEAHRQFMVQQQEKYEETIKAKDEAHEQLMTELHKRFDETVAKMSAQLKDDTSKILKERQEELQKSSNESLDKIVDPLKDKLQDLKKVLDDNKKESAENNGKMDERIKSLIEQTNATQKSAEELAKALKHGTKMQGDWGELVLTEILEAQGLKEGRHFDVQATICDECGNAIKAENGRMMRPDVIVHLDNTRELIIDSKVSLTSYIDYVNAEDEASRQDALQKHVASVRQHVKELAKKDYSSYIVPPKQSVDYVIMFMPLAGALSTAMNADTKLWREAADMGVFMADEQSLYACLRIVHLTWTQIEQVKNQQKVFDLAQEMLDRTGKFLKYYNEIGKKLNDAQGAYNDGMKKLQDGGYSINTTAKQLLKLGVKSDNPEIKALPE